MDISTLYWILILPNLGNWFAIIGSLLSMALGGIIIAAAVSIDCTYHDDDKISRLRKTRDKAVKAFIIPIIFFLISSFIPSSKQMMYLIGGYAVTNVENIDKLPKNVVNAANKFLETYTFEDKK